MHLYNRAPEGWDAGHDRLWSRSARIVRREVSSRTVAFIVIASVLAVTITIVFCAYFYRKSKTPRTPGLEAEDKKPGLLGRLFGSWRSKGKQYEPASGDDSTDDQRHSHQLNPTRSSRTRDVEQGRTGRSTRNNNRNNTTTAAVDRNTSVRSVMTLPAYRPMAATHEQVLGREGERDGVDVILDLPTAEEEEALRDEEMEALYQIRATRRQQIAEREERRQQRRDARARNDTAALRDLRARTTAANNDTTIRELRTEVERIKDNRQRSVSSVSYADVGIARHDGTRIRANSTESERVGLLSDAASIAASQRSGAQSHHRARSGSSAVSIDSDFSSPVITRSRGDSQSLTPREGRAGSSPELIEADLGDESMPPPEYEDVSLDDARSITPHNEPPPNYPGPYRSTSVRTERDLGTTGRDETSAGHSGHSTPSLRGVDSVPQLPSLRIAPLPQIVIEPSSAHPRDGEQHRL